MNSYKNIDTNSVFKQPETRDFTYRISYQNINTLAFTSPQDFGTILFDSNLNCNLHCVYCHNFRSTQLMKEEDFVKFIETQVNSVENFQIGCAMEPTMDKRMTKFAKIVANSKAKPYGYFRLQTNGTLLHVHNIDEIRQAGIDKITVSIDTIDPEIHKVLRGGSDLKKILDNISNLKKQWPESGVQFITTVSSLNINCLADLCEFAINSGISHIELRKMFYIPSSTIIKDHDKMKTLVLTDEEFDSKVRAVVERYKNNIAFYVNGSSQLERHTSKEKTK